MNVETTAEQLLFTTLRIETHSQTGTGTGTAFLFNYAHSGQNYPFVVTNRHVIKSARTGIIQFHKGNNGKLALGTAHRFEVEEFENLWTGHPDPEIDVAVMPLVFLLVNMQQTGITPFFKTINRELTASPQLISELDALEEIMFIGYPNGIWDSKHFLPVMRKGITATPIAIDFQGKKQFLVDASVFPGSSGSPVFLFNKGIYSDRQGNTKIGMRLAFLGVIAAVFFRQDNNEIKLMPNSTANRPVAVAREMIDLGIVFKAHTVIETIEALLRQRGISLDDLKTTA